MAVIITPIHNDGSNNGSDFELLGEVAATYAYSLNAWWTTTPLHSALYDEIISGSKGISIRR